MRYLHLLISAVLAFTATVAGAQVCSPQLGVQVAPADGTFDRTETIGGTAPGILGPLLQPGDILNGILADEDCMLRPCMVLDSLREDTKEIARRCILYSETGPRGALKFFADAFGVELRSASLPRRVSRLTELSLMVDGTFITFEQGADRFHTGRHANGRRLIAIEAIRDVTELRKGNSRSPIDPPVVGEMTLIRYHPLQEGWLRLSCFELGSADLGWVREKALSLSRDLRFVDSCPQ